jgi:hypothetical protein
MELTLSSEERELLFSILEQHHRELLNEIWHAHHREFKNTLRKNDEIVESLLNRLQEVPVQATHG